MSVGPNGECCCAEQCSSVWSVCRNHLPMRSSRELPKAGADAQGDSELLRGQSPQRPWGHALPISQSATDIYWGPTELEVLWGHTEMDKTQLLS